jgi:hypothetical protein
MTNWKQFDAEIDNAILNGTAMDAFEKFYADDVKMQEASGEPTVGKDANRQRELDFFNSVEAFHGAQIRAKGYDDEKQTSLAEWMYDVTFKGGQRVKMEQVATRHWKDGKVVFERFFYDKH